MRYEWFIAGKNLHLMPDDSYSNTLCGVTVNGRSSDSFNEKVNIYPTCKNCMRLKDRVVSHA